MRRPQSGKSPAQARELVPPRVAQFLAALLMIVSLQQPWIQGVADARPPVASLRGADSWLVVLAIGIAVAGIAMGAGSWTSRLKPQLMKFLWLAQLPLLGVTTWFLIWQEASHHLGFGVGAGLALAGVFLAAEFGPGAMSKQIKPIALGALVLVAAIVSPILQAIAGAGWVTITLTTGFALMNLYLTWWLLVPIWQQESQLATRIFPPGRIFPKTSLEQVVARAMMLVAFGAVVAVFALAHGGASQVWAAHLANPGLAVLLLPALGAAGLAIADTHWHRCIPVLLRRAVAQVALFTATAICAYFALSFALQMIENGANAALIVGLTLIVLVPGLGWLQTLGYLNVVNALTSLGARCRSVLVQPAQSEPASSSFEILADLPIDEQVEQQAWTGGHQWVGPTLSEVEGEQTSARAAESGSSNTTDQIAADELAALVIEHQQTPAAQKAPRAETTAHVPLAIFNQTDTGQVGISNPAFTDSGRLVVPLARPKWTPQQAMDPATHPALLARIAAEAPHLRPQVARNPSASVELLEWLSALDDPDVNLALSATYGG